MEASTAPVMGKVANKVEAVLALAIMGEEANTVAAAMDLVRVAKEAAMVAVVKVVEAEVTARGGWRWWWR